jgi:hypothetical protein
MPTYGGALVTAIEAEYMGFHVGQVGTHEQYDAQHENLPYAPCYS